MTEGPKSWEVRRDEKAEAYAKAGELVDPAKFYAFTKGADWARASTMKEMNEQLCTMALKNDDASMELIKLRKEFDWFVSEINKYVMPGETDSKDSAHRVFKELNTKLKWAEHNRDHAMDNERVMRKKVDSLLTLIQGQCGIPDASEACRQILKSTAKFKGEAT